MTYDGGISIKKMINIWCDNIVVAYMTCIKTSVKTFVGRICSVPILNLYLYLYLFISIVLLQNAFLTIASQHSNTKEKNYNLCEKCQILVNSFKEVFIYIFCLIFYLNSVPF